MTANPVMTEGWHLIHWTYDPNREIGSVPATERTTVGSWNHNPLAEAADEIERLKQELLFLRNDLARAQRVPLGHETRGVY